MRKKPVLLFLLIMLLFLALSSQSSKAKSTSKKETSSTQIQLPAPDDTLLQWMTSMKNESQMYRDRGETAKAEKILTRCIKGLWREPNSAEEFEKLAWIFTNRAYLYNNLFGDYLSAKEDYLAALKNFERCEPSDYLVARYVYQPLGNIYTRLGENEIAISMLEKFKLSCEQNNEIEALMSAYNDIGKAYLNMGQIELGIDWMLKGIQLNPNDHFSMGLLYSSKSEAEVELEANDAAFESAEKCIEHVNEFIRLTDETDFRYELALQYRISGFSAQAHIFARRKDYAKAHQLFVLVNNLAKEVYPKGHRARARATADLGKSFGYLGDKKEAIKYLQQSLCSMFEELDSVKISSNPAKKELYADVVLGEVLYQKALIAHELFKEENDKKWLSISIETYLKYFEWVEIQRTEQFEFYSKLGAANEIHTIGESALEAFFDLSLESNEPKWIDMAFVLMDQTKAIVLAEERGFKDLASANPKMRGMLQKQNALKFQRSQFQSDLIDLGQIAPENSAEAQRLKKRISEIDKESQLLDQAIRELFPSYRLEASSTLDDDLLVNLKKKLDQKEASVLSYFVGNESVFVISGAPNRFHFNRFSRSELSTKMQSFLVELNVPNTSNPQKYSAAGKSLYDLLIDAKAKNLSSNWLILPDGIVNGLPFEALVTKADGKSFKQLEYLVRDHIIHYAPSAFFFAHDASNKKAEKSFLGIAPVFKSSNKFDYLPKSEEELELGARLFSGEKLIENQATKRRFLKRANHYEMLHISTHAGTNSGTNNDAWMVFSDGKSNDFKLEAYELLKLDLPASLVVLNACETGSGTVFQGEGPMSLARGFLNAGSESTITNLWSVNHESNATIMKYFYESLSETNSPSHSLSEAKLAYLKSGEIDDASAHPFYWSAPILIGSDASVSPPSSSSLWMWLLIGVGSVVFIGLLFFQKLRKNRG